ncbi:HAD family hydrolase [Oceanicaulis sp. LC35]|uniref:HAD family hydrolase n=1 Tax=Oceanicaulis sp. LC35 TaxID=3349635 RepID=UPI003F86F4C5
MSRAVLWDLGHTLVDWDPRRVYRSLLSDDAAVEQFLGGVCTMAWHTEHDRGVPMAENRKPLIDAHPDKAELITAWDTHWPDMFDGWITGMEAVVDALNAQGVAQYALTNLPAEKWSHIEETYPKIAAFDTVVVSGAEKMVKPDPRLYQLTIDRIGHAPEDVLFIDDREDNIRAGIEAGFKGHVFRGAEGAIQAIRDHGIAL